MVEFKTKKPSIVLNLDNTIKVSFDTSKSYLQFLDNMEDCDYIVQLKKYKPKRSLSQNAYMWVLLGKLGEILTISREELYKTYIRQFGKFEILPIKTEAVETFKAAFEKGRTGNIVEIKRESKFEGYTTVIAYYGSSLYDSTEMAHLIEPIVQDCEEQGIQTMTYNEIMSLKNDNE